MHIKTRIKMLKRFSQAAAPSQSASPTTPTSAPTTQTQQTINIQQVPNFKPQLFSARPDIINDLNIIANIINKYLIVLSGGKVSFNIVWNNPSITGSEFSNSVKNLVNIAKWIYSVVRSNANAYTIEGLAAIGTGLINTVRSYSFPEPQATNVPSELIRAGQMILSKLGAV